jgi:autotransporter-associated beta strand protein
MKISSSKTIRAILAGALAAVPVMAATDTWVGNTDTSWNTSANWSAGVTPVNGDSLVFGAAGSSGTSLNNNISGLTAGKITFNSGAGSFTVSGNALTVGAGGIDASALSSGTQTFNNTITIGNGLQKWNVGAGATLALGSIGAGADAADLYTPNGAIAILSKTGTIKTTTADGWGWRSGAVAGTGLLGPGTVIDNGDNTYDWASVGSQTAGTSRAIVAATYTPAPNSGDAHNVRVTANTTVNPNASWASILVSNATLTVNGTQLYVDTGIILENGGTITGSRPLKANSDGLYIYVPDSGTIASAIQNNGTTAKHLYKAGPGTLNLSGNDTYTGNTVIHQGALVLGGSATLVSSPNIILKSGTTLDVGAVSFTRTANQTLQGAGLVNGSVTLSDASASIKPGDNGNGSVGTLTITTNLTLTAGVLTFDLSTNSSAGNDQIVVTNNLSLDSNETIYINALMGSSRLATNADYVLFQVVNGTTTMTGTPTLQWLGTTPANYLGFSIQQAGNNVVLHYTAPVINPPSITSSTGSPNPVNLGSNVLFSVTVTAGTSPTITSVVVDDSAIGGSGWLSLDSAGGGVFTNTVPVASATAYGSALSLPVTVTDDNSLTAAGAISLTVNSPTLYAWNGGYANWSDVNWLPNDLPSPLLSGPTSGAGVRVVVTNGQVVEDITGGVNGVGVIEVAETGTLLLGNSSTAKYAFFNNLLFTGGTVDTVAGSYHAYGASVLSAVAVSGSPNSVIINSGGVWFNLDNPSSTFTVSNGATLTVSAPLRGAIGIPDTTYFASGLIKNGGGTLVLSGANTFIGEVRVSAGTLQVDAMEALPANSALVVASGAQVNLNYGGTISLATLVLNGVTNSPGTYGATGSGAEHINDTYFSGTGLVVVSGAGPNAILTWMATVNNTWDDSTLNWTNSTSATAWFNGASGPNSAIFGTNGAGSVNLSFSGAFFAGNITFNAEGYDLSGAAALGNTPGFVVNSNATISAVLSGTGGLTKTGNAVLSLSGVSTYTGDTTISGGVLTLTNGGSIYNAGWNGSSVLTVQAGGVLELDKWGYGPNAGQSLGGLDYNPARFIINGGTVRCTGGAAAAPANAGEARYGPGFTIGTNGATLDAAKAADTWTVKNDSRGYGPISSTEGGTLTLTGVGDGVFDKVLGGTGGVTKKGSGTWTLNLASTYTGGTVVSNGTLLVSGSIASTNILVAGGALSLASTTALVSNASLTVATGALVNLNYGGTITLGSLVLNGVSQAPGTYDAANQPAYLSGSGSLVVPGAGPAVITNSITGNNLLLNWPAGQGWRLVSQTNSLSVGLSPTGWGTVEGATDGSYTIAIDPVKPCVFYRLVNP